MANGVRTGKKREARAQYLQRHGHTLERVAQHCINEVLKERPSDPYQALLDRFSKHTKAGVRFDELKCYATARGEIFLELSAVVRGSSVSIHRQTIATETLVAGLKAVGAPDIEADVEPGLLAARLGARLRNIVKDVGILDLVKLDQALADAFPTKQEDEAALPATVLRAALLDFFLAASGSLLGDGTLAAVRAILASKSVPLAAPLHCRSDLRPWMRSWPRLLVPASEGPGATLFVGSSLWGARVPEASALPPSSPARYVDEIARLSRQIDAAKEDGIELVDEEMHQDDEFCPILNSAKLAARLAWEVASIWASSGAAGDSEEKLASALNEFDNAVKQVAPSLDQAASTKLEDELLLSSSLLFWAIDFRGPTLYNQEDGLYHFPGEEAGRSSDELVKLICQLVHNSSIDKRHNASVDSNGSNNSGKDVNGNNQNSIGSSSSSSLRPALNVIFQPFSGSDPNFGECLAKLRAATMSEGVVVLGEASELKNPARGLGALLAEMVASREAAAVESSTPVEAEAEVAEASNKTEEEEIPNSAVAYDFRGPGETFLQVGVPSLLALLLTTPTTPGSRLLLLPKKEKPEELLTSLTTLDSSLGAMIASTYTRERPTDKREQGKTLVEIQFRAALKDLKWSDATKCSKAIFDFLDWRKDGFISEDDLAILAETSGPASLEKVDAFRVWLCQTAKSLEELRASKGTPFPEGPMRLLVRKMDPEGSGSITYHDFYRALKLLKHPDATTKHSGPILELFASIDLSKTGRLSIEDFFHLTVLSARHQLTLVTSVCKFFQQRFGSYKAGWKVLDTDGQGQLDAPIWVDLMQKQGYQNRQELEVCAYFIDRDGSMMLSGKDFELLSAFTVENVVADLERLRSHWEQAHGSLEDAFRALVAECAATTLNAEAFTNAVRNADLALKVHGRLLFKALDPTRTGQLMLEDFIMLKHQHHVDALAEASESLKAPTSSLHRFLSWWCLPKVANVEGSEAHRWKRLHQEMLRVTADEIY